MYLSHLSLTHFRNYQQLDLDFTKSLTLLQGQNAQGKTNLLEAIYYVATSKPIHAQSEREVVDWLAAEEPIPYCRIAATVQPTDDARAQEIEIFLTPRGDGVNYKKQVKINGVGKRAMDLIGLMRAVLFLPEDIKLVAGSPGERRRYLDVALCQIERDYTVALSRYQKVITQRNSLLKTLREEGAQPHDARVDAQLGFWDAQLVEHGSYVIAKRHNFVMRLEPIAQRRHTGLSGARETLMLRYVPSFNPGNISEAEYQQLKEARGSAELVPIAFVALTPTDVAEHFTAKLHSRRTREIAAGNTLYGPHRDDLHFLANGRDLRTYGSRGQQRTAALSTKLAEVEAMTEAIGRAPLLLLDDVMSELDAQRRSMLLDALEGVPQAILTTTDWEDFTAEFRQRSQLLHVAGGTITTS